jgi:hypothetical protein
MLLRNFGKTEEVAAREARWTLPQDLVGLRLDELRIAIRSNQVTFPSQVPTFPKRDRADLQWRLVQLYFVLGWNCESIGAKYGLRHRRVRQILSVWKRRAIALGYIQSIPTEQQLQGLWQRLQESLQKPSSFRQLASASW